jgi:hypothetical protein
MTEGWVVFVLVLLECTREVIYRDRFGAGRGAVGGKRGAAGGDGRVFKKKRGRGDKKKKKTIIP